MFKEPNTEELNQRPEVVLGVDTHLDVHVGVVIDALGRVQGTLAVATNPAGYEKLLAWAAGFGVLRRAGVEGTNSYGAGLTRMLKEHAIRSLRSTGPTAPDAAAAARTIRPTQKALRVPCWQATPKRPSQGPEWSGRGLANFERGAAQRRQGQDASDQPVAQLAGECTVLHSRRSAPGQAGAMRGGL